MSPDRQEELRRAILALGFDEVRFAAVSDPVEAAAFNTWLESGMHADMAWISRTADKRLHPEQVLPGVRSMILLGVSYAADAPQQPSAGASPRIGPVWARYALHDDYHDTLKPALIEVGKLLESRFGLTGEQYRYYVDAGPVLERGWAARAGLGFLGKNAMMISRRHGNWLLLAAVLTPLELLPDEPIRRNVGTGTMRSTVGLLCGKCTRCIDACPTRAFAAPGLVDSRRCISYQTIENRGIIPRELRPGLGARIYGCDICLEVCPWNRFAREGRQMLLVRRGELAELSLTDLLTLTPERYAVLFRGTPIKRVKLAGLLRNACIVAANVHETSVLPLIVALAGHPSAIVRAHAVWAVYRLAERTAAEAWLQRQRQVETDPLVLAEFAAAEAAPTAATRDGGG